MKKSYLKKLLLGGLALGAIATAPAAHAGPFSIEAVMQTLPATVDPVDGSVTVRCGMMDMKVVPPTIDSFGNLTSAGTDIRTPTKKLAIADLILKGTGFPESGGVGPSWGVPRNGFEGGSCIADGNTLDGVNVADKLAIDISESIVVGVVTATAAGVNGVSSPDNVRVNGVAFTGITDGRLSLSKIKSGSYTFASAAQTVPDQLKPGFAGIVSREEWRSNEGLGIVPTTVLANRLAAVSGYWGVDHKLHAFDVTADGQIADGKTQRPAIVKVSAIASGNGKNGKDTLRVIGGCALGASATLTVRIEYLHGLTNTWVAAGATPTTPCARVVPAVAFPTAVAATSGVGRFTFLTKTANFNTVCPKAVRAIINIPANTRVTPPIPTSTRYDYTEVITRLC